ncbi:hypothetical protein OROHE_011110 [Orobanche hederae]
MSLRILYSSGKGKYTCYVCSCSGYDIFHSTRQQDMINHINSVHPKTALACKNRHGVELPKDLQEGVDEDDAAAREPTSEDLFLSSLTDQKLKDWHMDSIACDSHEDAVKKIEIISKLPKEYFIKCFFPCVVDGSMSMAVEQYKKTFSYPTKGHIQDSIRGIMPVEFKNYQTFRADIDLRSLQICECVDRIVDQTHDEGYRVFRSRLSDSKTSVDLHSMFFAPYLTPEREQPIHFCSSRILSPYTKKDRKSFNTIIADFWTELKCLASSNLGIQTPWQEILKNSKHQDLIDMLDSRFAPDGTQIPYEPTSCGNHELIFNSIKHINDNQQIQMALDEDGYAGRYAYDYEESVPLLSIQKLGVYACSWIKFIFRLIIMYALHFLHILVGGQQSIGGCIAESWEHISVYLSKFSMSRSAEFGMHISDQRKGTMEKSAKWPSFDDVRKIAGLNFIITGGGMSSFADKTYDQYKFLVGMLRE